VKEAPDQVGALEGDVVNLATDEPVPRARLTFFGPEGIEEVSADEDGHFGFHPGQEGSYELAAVAAEGFLPFAPELGHSPIVLYARKGRGVRGVRVQLTPRVDYVGLVLTPEGEPAVGATVRELEQDREGLSLVDSPDDYRTDADGQFHFHALDGAVLEASHPDYDRGRAKLDFSAQVSHRLTIRLGPPGSAPAQCAIRGTVRGADGEPIEDARVSARSERSGARSDRSIPHPGAHTLSDDGGSFLLEGLDVDSFTVVAQGHPLAPRTVRGVQCPTDGLDLTLEDGLSVWGTVRDAASSEAIPSFAVVVTEPSGPLTHDVVWVESTFDAEGRYEIAALSPGKYRITVLAHGFASAPERDIALESAPVRADFSLSRGSRLWGTVVSRKSGGGIEGAKVSLEGQLGRGPRGLPLTTSARSDAEGRFELLGVPTGEQTLMVAAAEHHGRIVSGLMVQGAELGPIQVELTKTKEDESPRIELAGIGAVLSAEGDALIIGGLLEGGGADEAGLVQGDGILGVDGTPVAELGFKGSIDRIRGPEGTRVTLTVRRKASGETDELEVERRIVRG